MKILDDKEFLSIIYSYERQLAKLLAVLLAVVIGIASVQLLVQSGGKSCKSAPIGLMAT